MKTVLSACHGDDNPPKSFGVRIGLVDCVGVSEASDFKFKPTAAQLSQYNANFAAQDAQTQARLGLRPRVFVLWGSS